MTWLRSKFDDTVAFHVALWTRNTLRMKILVDEALAQPIRELGDKRQIIVVVMPWNATDVPWFSIMCGLLLAEAGHAVTFVVDDVPFGDYPARSQSILMCLKAIMRRIATRHPVLSLRKFSNGSSPGEPTVDRIRELAALNALRDLRGEMIVEGRARKTALFERQLGLVQTAVSVCLDNHPAEIIVLPGGLHASSGVWNETARPRGIRVATFDGGSNGTSLWAVDGIASHFPDVERLFGRMQDELKGDELDFVISTAQREIDARRAGIDKFGAQMKGTSADFGPEKGFVVIALNVPWDTQALDRHICFDRIDQFIVESVRYVLEASNLHVVVRQHPAERLKITRSSEDYRALLTNAFGSDPRVHFVAPEDPVNTYALIEHSIATIVHTSTIGIEAVLFGKPALTGSNPYYGRLGAVYTAQDKEAYRALLGQILQGKLPVTDTMRHNAQLSYYISQCNGWIVTPFNIGSFSQWSRMRFADIAAAPQQRLLMEAIAQDIPIAWQNHLIRMSEYRSRLASAA